MSKLSERKLIRAAIARKAAQAIATTLAITASTVEARPVAIPTISDRILAGKTTTSPFRTVQGNDHGNKVVITANKFCGLCATELDCLNAIEVLFASEKQTTVTYANCCSKCTSKALCLVKKVDRKRILSTIANEIALNFLFELGENFSSSEEFLSTNWFDEFIGEEIARSLRLNDKALLPWICCGRANRKRIRRAQYKDAYQLLEYRANPYIYKDLLSISGKISRRIDFLTSAINNHDVSPSHEQKLISKRFWLADRLSTRCLMGI